MDPVAKNIQTVGMELKGKMMPLNRTQMTEQQKDKLQVVANEFEAIFVQQIFKQARQSQLADGLFDNSGNETFKTMLDQEYASSMAQSSSLGIAEAMIQQLSPSANSKNMR